MNTDLERKLHNEGFWTDSTIHYRSITMADLIEKTGLKALVKNDVWRASRDEYEGLGETPEDAIANLWLDIHGVEKN